MYQDKVRRWRGEEILSNPGPRLLELSPSSTAVSSCPCVLMSSLLLARGCCDLQPPSSSDQLVTPGIFAACISVPVKTVWH